MASNPPRQILTYLFGKTYIQEQLRVHMLTYTPCIA